MHPGSPPGVTPVLELLLLWSSALIPTRPPCCVGILLFDPCLFLYIPPFPRGSFLCRKEFPLCFLRGRKRVFFIVSFPPVFQVVPSPPQESPSPRPFSSSRNVDFEILKSLSISTDRISLFPVSAQSPCSPFLVSFSGRKAQVSRKSSKLGWVPTCCVFWTYGEGGSHSLRRATTPLSLNIFTVRNELLPSGYKRRRFRSTINLLLLLGG